MIVRTSLYAEALDKVQEAFDQTTRLTLEAKRMAHDIIISGQASATTRAMCSEGFKLMKDLVGPTEVLETILQDVNGITSESDAINAMRQMAPIYKQLLEFVNELRGVHRRATSSARGSRG